MLTNPLCFHSDQGQRMHFDRLKRRQFITLLGSAAAQPLAARAQQPERMRRIGVLAPGANRPAVAAQGFRGDAPEVGLVEWA
jgi:hypothetical protein